MTTLRTGAIAVEIEGALSIAQCRDGAWLVQAGADTSIVACSHGAMLNCRGTNEAKVHESPLTLPQRVVPGDSLVVAVAGTGRGTYWNVPGNSSCTEATAVCFVGYPVGPDMLHPPAIGNDPFTRLVRMMAPLPESLVSVARLPSVIDVGGLSVDWSRWGAQEPTIPYLTALLSQFGGEFYDGWGTHYGTPDRQHAGYGTNQAIQTSQALVQLCSLAPAATKRPLALAVAQRGIDLLGAFVDGRRTYPSGGHAAGRKALIVAAEGLLGVDLMQFVPSGVFQEDGCYRDGPWWFPCWDARWQFQVNAPLDGSQLANPPSTWGAVDDHTPNSGSQAWAFASYLPQVVGAQIGTALAMRMMGKVDKMGRAFDRMVAQFMQGAPPAADAELRACGIVTPWGSDYSVVRGAGFCAAAWKRHAQ